MLHEHTRTNSENASVSRRDLLTAVAAGAVVTMAPDAVAGELDKLDQLIARHKMLNAKHSALLRSLSAIEGRADRPAFPRVILNEVDPGRYTNFLTKEHFSAQSIREFFEIYHTCLFGSERVRQIHLENEQSAIDLLEARIAARKAWDDANGLTALETREIELGDTLAAIEKSIFFFPCSDFSMVARKIGFLREWVGTDNFTADVGTAIILSMDGSARSNSPH